MITVWGEGRGFRVVWLLEEMGLPYRLREVDLIADVREDVEFMAINPSGFIPALQDGHVTMVESIAIMEFLITRHGPTSLAPEVRDPSYGRYLQFLHLGEAGLAGSMYWVVVSRNLAPEAERDNFGARKARQTFENRLQLVTRQLASTPYLAGEHFTAADISVTYALEFAERAADFELSDDLRQYVARTTSRDAYQRAMARCPATSAWANDAAARHGKSLNSRAS